jgi:hypothetical protein
LEQVGSVAVEEWDVLDGGVVAAGWLADGTGLVEPVV